MDNFEHALEKEVRRLNGEVSGLQLALDYWKASTANEESRVKELRAEVERLTRERDEAREWATTWSHRAEDWKARAEESCGWLGDITEAVCGERPVGVMPGTTLDAVNAIKARAEAAEADNAALRKVISAVAVDAPGRVARVLDEHKPIITAEHPGAALLARLRAAERVVEAARGQDVDSDSRKAWDRLSEALAAYDALKEKP